MQILSDVEWGNLAVNDSLISATGRLGKIEALEPFYREDKLSPDMSLITMKWQYIQNPSVRAHKCLTKVIWFGQDEEAAVAFQKTLGDSQQ